jgi:hypothetical protein
VNTALPSARHTLSASTLAWLGGLCLLGIAVLGQELIRVALDLRNPNGTYTLGVGQLRLSGSAGLGARLYWASHAWLVVIVWRLLRRAGSRLELVIAILVVAGIIGIRVLLFSMPLNQMIIRPWIR